MNKELNQKVLEKHSKSDIDILEYNGFNHKVKYRCNKCGQIDYRNQYKTLLYSKYGCKKCNDGSREKSKTLIEIENKLTDDIQLIQWNGVNNRAKLYCKKCDTYFYRYPHNILKNPSYCENCSIIKSQQPRDIEEAQLVLNKYTNSEDFIILEYKGSQNQSLIKHSCGFIFKRKLWNFNTSRGCPKCHKKQSTLEKAVEQYLINNNIDYNFQVRFKDCNNGKSSFDFQCFYKDTFCLIEVQGQQHYKDISIFDSLENNIRRDNIKKEYCLANGILLIEIPYYDIDKIDQYLSFLKSSTTIS